MESKILKLRILTAAIRLKFKCRARIECGDANTQEAASNNGIFTFQEELHIFPKGNAVELSLILISEKGSWYNGGCIKATIDQLRHSGGLPLKLMITKCIDREAWIEIQALSVPEIIDKSSQRQLSFTQHRVQNGVSFIHTPERRKGNLVIQQNLAETRSEHGINQPFTNFNLTHERKFHDTGRHVFGQFSNVRMQKNKERRISPFQSGPNRVSPEQWASQDEVIRARQEADLSAGKLKKMQEKCKQQQENLRSEQEKRKTAEFSEHNYKMEVLKLNIYKEEKEKQFSRKELKIKQLETECRENSKRLAHLKEDLNNKNAQIDALKNEAKKYRTDFEKTNSQVEWCRKQCDEKLAKIQKESSAIADDREDALNELRRKFKNKEDELNSANNKLSKLQEENERQKKLRLNVESKYSEAKSDYERTISNIRKELKSSKDQWGQAASKYEWQRTDSNKELTSIREECDRLKVASSKLIIQKRSLEQQLATLEQSSSEFKKYREKYIEQCSKTKSLKDQLSKLKRRYQNTLENNHKLEERLKNSSHKLEEYNGNCQILEVHSSQLEEKIRNIQKELDEKTLLMDKLRKSEEEAVKECLQLREREKQTKAYLSRKDVELTKMKLELDNLTEKLGEVREVRLEPSQRYYPSYDEQLQESKYGILETQRYMDMEIVTHKHTIAQLENQLSRSKEEANKYNRIEYEWRDLERTWEAEKLKISTQNSRLAKELKQIIKKIAEEQTKVATLNEKLQKEKKNSKSWQQKCITSETSLRKAQDGREQMLSELEIKEGRLKMMESQMVLSKGETQLRQTEGNKLRSANESLQSQNRRLRQQVTQLGVRLREQQMLLVNQSKKARQEMTRCESRLVNIKRESEKFKQSLRSVLVESIVGQISKDHQGESLAKKRQNKLGLTLTNQLIIRLEDYLRELSRHKVEMEQKLRATEKELVVMREESILKTNQFQNSEAQLKNKLDQLMDNLAKMKDMYEVREEDMRKALAETEWQLTIKDKELQRLEESATNSSKRLEGEAIAASEAFNRTQRALNTQSDKLKTKIKQQAQKQTSYCQQIASLEEYITSLEEKTAKYRDREFELQQKLEKLGKQSEQNRSRSESLAQSLQQCNKQKSQVKNLLSFAEAEAQECKLLCDRYKGQLDVLEREKSEGSTTVRSVMKEKEALLHQYLASEQKAFQLETQLLAAQEQLSEVSSQLQAAGKVADQMKEQKKKSGSECKTLEATLAKKQNQLRELQQKCKDKQRHLSKLTQQNTFLQGSLSQLKGKLDASVKSWELKLAQAEKAIEIANSEAKSHNTRSQSIAQKCESLEQQLKRVKQSMQSQQASLQQVTQRLSESLQTNQKMEVEVFSCKSELTQLRIDVSKAKEELQEKDLKNYMISSELYKIEEASARQVSTFEDKISAHEQAMLKYEQICEDFATEVELLKQAKGLAEKAQADSEEELSRMSQRLRALSDELEAAKRTMGTQETELGRLQEGRLQLQSARNNEDQRSHQAILELQQELDKRECDLQRSKNEVDLLHEMLKKLEENCREGEAELQEMLRRCTGEAESAKRHEIQLKKVREDLKQLTWTNQRELKKLLKAKLRALSEAGEEGCMTEQLKSVEESLLEMLGRYDAI